MTKVFVYMNLHASRKEGRPVYSVKALSGPHKGRVIIRSPEVLIKDAAGKVSESGRQRVLREERKNVHAGIVGELVAVGDSAWRTGPNHRKHLGGWRKVTYNPYKYTGFVYKDDETSFLGSQLAYLGQRGVETLQKDRRKIKWT